MAGGEKNGGASHAFSRFTWGTAVGAPGSAAVPIFRRGQTASRTSRPAQAISRIALGLRVTRSVDQMAGSGPGPFGVSTRPPRFSTPQLEIQSFRGVFAPVECPVLLNGPDSSRKLQSVRMGAPVRLHSMHEKRILDPLSGAEKVAA
jgi:hypothetical protein